jgi:hypothetical protein
MPEHVELLHLVRAVAAIDGIELRPGRLGVRPAGRTGGLISWPQVRATLGSDDPLDPAPRLRLELLVELHQVLGELGVDAAAWLGRACRAMALPVGHPLHPGRGWVRHRLPGGVLDLGLGVAGLLPGRSGPVPLPTEVAEAAGITPDAGWDRLWQQAERLGALAGRHLASTGDSAVIRSAGGCDALTLAATHALRDHLLGSTGAAGLPVAAPRRDQVLTGDRAGDRDRTRATWLLTSAAERGVLEPLRLTGTGVEPVQLRTMRV